MIKSITKQIENEILKVTVETQIRNFAIEPIKILETEEVIKLLKSEYKIIKLLNSPASPVGNTRRKGIVQKGVWIFQIYTETPKKTPTIKRAPRKKPTSTTKKTLTKTSVRTRMSKVAEELNKKRK